jgi:hypothetical protein
MHVQWKCDIELSLKAGTTRMVICGYHSQRWCL